MTADQMADALRALGWTCTPPEPAPPTRRVRVERELAKVLRVVWTVGGLEELMLRAAAPRHTFRAGTPAETRADLAAWLLRAPTAGRWRAWRVIEAKAPKAAAAAGFGEWFALVDLDAEAVAAWLDAPDDLTPAR